MGTPQGKPNQDTSQPGHRQIAAESLTAQAEALNNLALNLNGEFDDAVRLVVECKGRVVICGMGKPGLVGKKMAARPIAVSGDEKLADAEQMIRDKKLRLLVVTDTPALDPDVIGLQEIFDEHA